MSKGTNHEQDKVMDLMLWLSKGTRDEKDQVMELMLCSYQRGLITNKITIYRIDAHIWEDCAVQSKN